MPFASLSTRFVLLSDLFVLSAWAIWSALSHQNCPSPASSCRLPKCMAGFTCPPNIQPSSLLAISLKVLEGVNPHLVQGADRLSEQRHGLARTLRREVVVEHELPDEGGADAEDRVGELADV